MFDAPTHRRENIVLTAIELIHQTGACSLSTKEIARRVGISESSIFKLFPKKNDLLSAVLDRFCLFDRDLFTTAQSTKTPAEAIPFYIECYVTYYENYPAITALLEASGLFRGMPELAEQASTILVNRWQYMKELIKSAQDSGFLSSEADTDRLADIFTSTFNGMCVKWRLADFRFSLREETLRVFSMLLAAFRPR